MVKYDLLSDDALLELIKLDGDHLAYTEIFERYFAILYQHALNKLRDEFEAEDVVQEVFSKIWFGREELDGKQNFKAFLFILTRNLVIDKIRKRQVVAGFAEAYVKLAVSPNAPADYLVREKQLGKMIEHEISLLPPRMREVFELRQKKQLSNKEIAIEMGIKETTVADQMKKALKILRTRLQSLRILLDVLIF